MNRAGATPGNRSRSTKALHRLAAGELTRLATLASTRVAASLGLVVAVLTLVSLSGSLGGSQEQAWRDAEQRASEAFAGEPALHDQMLAAISACRAAVTGAQRMDPIDCPGPAKLPPPSAFFTDPVSSATRAVQDGSAVIATVATLIAMLLALHQVGSDWASGSLPAVLAASGRRRTVALARCLTLAFAGTSGVLLSVGVFAALAFALAAARESGVNAIPVTRVLVVAAGGGLVVLLAAALAMLARGVVAALAVLGGYLFIVEGFVVGNLVPQVNMVTLESGIYAVLRNGTEVYAGPTNPHAHLSAGGGLAVIAAFSLGVTLAATIQLGRRDLATAR